MKEHPINVDGAPVARSDQAIKPLPGVPGAAAWRDDDAVPSQPGGDRASGPLSRLPAIDLQALALAIGDDPALQQELLRVFMRVNGDIGARVRLAVIEADGPQIRRMAHTLKSSARVIGSVMLADICDRLENSPPARILDDARQWTGLIEQLMRDIDREVAVLDKVLAAQVQSCEAAAVV